MSLTITAKPTYGIASYGFLIAACLTTLVLLAFIVSGPEENGSFFVIFMLCVGAPLAFFGYLLAIAASPKRLELDEGTLRFYLKSTLKTEVALDQVKYIRSLSAGGIPPADTLILASATQRLLLLDEARHFPKAELRRLLEELATRAGKFGYEITDDRGWLEQK